MYLYYHLRQFENIHFTKLYPGAQELLCKPGDTSEIFVMYVPVKYQICFIFSVYSKLKCLWEWQFYLYPIYTW